MALGVTFCLSAQAPQPAPAKLPGEPHHHLKIDNAYVRAYYVELAPHEKAPLHQHDHDYIFLSLGPSDVINAVPGKPDVHLVLKDGEMRFARGGFAHVTRNLSDAPLRLVAIEFLRHQGEPQNLCAQLVPSSPLGICSRTSVSSKDRAFSLEPQMETAEAEVDLVRFSGKRCDSALYSGSLLVSLEDPGIQVNLEGSNPSPLHQGEMIWLGPNVLGYLSSLGGDSSRYLQVTFKDGGTRASD